VSTTDVAPSPAFVGGSGRSGTTVVGHLLGNHSQYAHPPYEVKFHTDPAAGLPGLLSGSTTVEAFLERMRTFWFRRLAPDGKEYGLFRSTSREDLERALRVFAKAFERAPIGASRALVHSIVDPVARTEGKVSWVDTTPSTMSCATTLARIFPAARFVHMVRDGRDVASSVARRAWGPASFGEGLEWWAERLRVAERQARAVGPEKVLVLRFEELADRSREASYGRLLDFLALDDEPAMREYFERRLTPARANLGRWHELEPADRELADRRYPELLEILRSEGITCAPSPSRELGG
jgi:hypothetical protein